METVLNIIKFFFDFIKGDVDLLQLTKSMVKYILTLITANIFFKWWYYEKYDYIDLTMENISNYIFSGNVLKPTICFLLAYLFFYGFLFSILRYLLSGWMERKISSKVNKFSDQMSDDDRRTVYSFMFRLYRKVIRWEYRMGILSKEELSFQFDNDTINEMTKDAFVTICICIHAIVVYGFFYKFFTIGMIILYAICIIVFAFISIIPIALRMTMPIANRVLAHEKTVQ